VKKSNIRIKDKRAAAAAIIKWVWKNVMYGYYKNRSKRIIRKSWKNTAEESGVSK